MTQSDGKYVDVNKALYKFADYVAGKNFTEADHVALFTGLVW